MLTHHTLFLMLLLIVLCTDKVSKLHENELVITDVDLTEGDEIVEQVLRPSNGGALDYILSFWAHT